MGSFLSSQSQPPPACSSAAPAVTATACPPQWMLLAPYAGGSGKADVTGDLTTMAAAATSNGDLISVSLHREPFSSALSRICLCYLPRTGYRGNTAWAGSTVIAAHGGAVLVRISSRESYKAPYAFDYFVYGYNNVIAAAADLELEQQPSLHLLPGLPHKRQLDISATGLLRCGEAEFVVAELTIVGSKDDVTAAAKATTLIAFELRLFRHGEWSIKQPWIIRGDLNSLDSKKLWAKWETIAAVPLGNGMLCWVDRFSGVIFSEVLDEGPNKLRYVAYPAESEAHRRERFVCTDVRGALKLVSMAPQHCSHCGCSEHDTEIHIWSLKMDDLAWVLETDTKMVDSAELWMLPNAPGYARVHLVCPVASMTGGRGVVSKCCADGETSGSTGDQQ